MAFILNAPVLPVMSTLTHQILFAGAAGSGRFSLQSRISGNAFPGPESYHHHFILRKHIIIDKIPANLDLASLDTDYRHLRDVYITAAEAIVIVYSISNRKSFDSLPALWKEINLAKYQKGNEALYDARGKVPFISMGLNAVPILLLGNKADQEGELERAVSVEEGKLMARRLGVRWGECSAMEGYGFEDEFRDLIVEVRRWRVEKRKRRNAVGSGDTKERLSSQERRERNLRKFKEFVSFGRKRSEIFGPSSEGAIEEGRLGRRATRA